MRYWNVCAPTHEYFIQKTQAKYQHNIWYLCFRCCRDLVWILREKNAGGHRGAGVLGPDREVHYYNFGSFKIFLKNGTHLYIQHELPISFAPVDKHNVMDYSDRMGSACVCSEGGLTAKRPFRDVLTEEGRLLKIFLQVSCWPSAASLAFKHYLFVVPKTNAKYSVQSKLQTWWPSLPPVLPLYLPAIIVTLAAPSKEAMEFGFHARLHLVAAFLAAA